ncbi:MAG TPA: anti-sigma factor antagonist [Bacillota bacterium]|nr:anti-sigma factor antagonist [Bacillota bacterium]
MVILKLGLEMTGNILVARVAGELDMRVTPEFRDRLDTALENEMAGKLLLNLSEVSFIDSSGLGAILGRYKRLTQVGGKLAIAAPQPQVKRILELSGILRIMNCYATEKEGLKKF